MTDLTLMLAEDEPLVALDIIDALQDQGVTVVGPCLTVEECFDLLARGERLDGAILDIDLAGKDVFPAAKELEKRGIPYVFHSARSTSKDLPSEFSHAALCSKPCRPDVLLDTMRSSLH